MPSLIEEKDVIGDLVLYEQPTYLSRDTGIILSGAGELTIGAVLGKQTKDTAEATADGGNTGDGAISAVTLGKNAEVGDYVLTCIATAGDGGTFEVVTPSGVQLPDLEVGDAYVGSHINLTVSDGATDFALDDTITITVSGTGKYDLYVVDAVDGLGEVAGVLLQNLDATSADVADALILTRDAVVSEQLLNFDASVDNAAKRTAVKEALLKLGIKVTQGA